MKLHDVKLMIAAMYVAVVGASGLAGGVTSAAGWVALAALALLPASAMLTLWKHPTQTLSESIAAARR
jgi:hypothetical protein